MRSSYKSHFFLATLCILGLLPTGAALADPAPRAGGLDKFDGVAQVAPRDDSQPADAPSAVRRRARRDWGRGTADGGDDAAGAGDNASGFPGPGGRGRMRQFMPDSADFSRGLSRQGGMTPMMRARLRNRMEGGLFGPRPLDLTSLNLTDAQKQKIQQTREVNGAKCKELRKTVRERKSELRDLMFDPRASDEAIRSKRKELRQLQDKVEELQINDFLAIRSVLTPEQKEKLVDLKPGANKVADGVGDKPAASPTPKESDKTSGDAPAAQ